MKFPTFKLNRNEISGSLGDMGTFVPLLVGMVNKCQLDLGSALLFAGIFNVITGFLFAIPIAVQPMKAIAAVAIAEGLTVNQILTAGILTGLVIFLCGITNMIDWLNRWIPKPVVRGLQLALGLKLLMAGFTMITGTNQFWGWDSILVGIVATVIVLIFFFSIRVPSALILFGCGLLLLLVSHPQYFQHLQIGIYLPTLYYFNSLDWTIGFWKGTVPQLPLTTLNSVIAVCALSRDLFPDKPASPRRVAISVGLMNLVGGWFGAMPMCHGAGGLAGQYRFGSRTSASIIFLGTIKIILGFFFGASLLMLIQHYPQSILGVLLAFSGIELALVYRDITERLPAFIMLVTAGACMGLSSMAWGFAIGWLVGWIMMTLQSKNQN